MSVKITIPTPLRSLTGSNDSVEVDAGTVEEMLVRLDDKYPGFRERLCDGEGSLRRFINVYVDGEDIRFLQLLATPVRDGAEVSIVPAISGG